MNAGARETRRGSQRWETQIDTERQDKQLVTQAEGDGQEGQCREMQDRKVGGGVHEPEEPGKRAVVSMSLSRGIFKLVSLPCASTEGRPQRKSMATAGGN